MLGLPALEGGQGYGDRVSCHLYSLRGQICLAVPPLHPLLPHPASGAPNLVTAGQCYRSPIQLSWRRSFSFNNVYSE